MRGVLAIAAGIFTTLILQYLAMVIFVLVTIGVPLGTQPRPMSITESIVLLTLAALAAAGGGHAAARIARQAARMTAAIVSVLLAIVLLWGFGGRNSWPAWWGPASAVVTALGVWIGGGRFPSRTEAE